MIKLDVILFFGGIYAVILGAVLIDTTAGAFLFTCGCLGMILAPVLTTADRRERRRYDADRWDDWDPGA